MTGAELAFTLKAMVSELRLGIRLVEGQMPEDAARGTRIGYVSKATGTPAIVLCEAPDPARYERVELPGAYFALQPLYQIVEGWTERIDEMEMAEMEMELEEF